MDESMAKTAATTESMKQRINSQIANREGADRPFYHLQEGELFKQFLESLRKLHHKLFRIENKPSKIAETSLLRTPELMR